MRSMVMAGFLLNYSRVDFIAKIKSFVVPVKIGVIQVASIQSISIGDMIRIWDVKDNNELMELTKEIFLCNSAFDVGRRNTRRRLALGLNLLLDACVVVAWGLNPFHVIPFSALAQCRPDRWAAARLKKARVRLIPPVCLVAGAPVSAARALVPPQLLPVIPAFPGVAAHDA